MVCLSGFLPLAGSDPQTLCSISPSGMFCAFSAGESLVRPRHVPFPGSHPPSKTSLSYPFDDLACLVCAPPSLQILGPLHPVRANKTECPRCPTLLYGFS